MTTQNNPPSPFINVHDPHGGADVQLPAIVGTDGNYTVSKVIPSGLGSTTAGVTDSLNKRFVTDAELNFVAAPDTSFVTDTADKRYVTDAELARLAGGSEQLLSTPGGVSVNMNVLNGETTLYTVPGGKTCVITKVVVRAASISLDTASYSFGFNAGTDADVIANATHTGLDGATKAIILSPIVTGFVLGAAAAVLACKVNTAQGVAATAKVDVFGYLY